MDVFEAIEKRRTHKRLSGPAPTDEDLTKILSAAARAPDHKELRPWQFIVIRGEKKEQLGNIMADALTTRVPGATPGQIEKERNKPASAPLIVAVVARAQPQNSLPFEEIYASACAATQNLLLAATALGFASLWRTGDAARDNAVKHFLQIEIADAIVGFIYLGSAENEPSARTPADLTTLVRW